MPVLQNYLFSLILYRIKDIDYTVGVVIVCDATGEYTVLPFYEGINEAYDAVGTKQDLDAFCGAYNIFPATHITESELVDIYFDLIHGKHDPLYLSDPGIAKHVSSQQVALAVSYTHLTLPTIYSV